MDARGIQIVTLSTDTPEEIRKSRGKHGVQATMLSDADLSVTDRFNLRNQTNIAPGGIRPMPIPTTFLVDAQGILRWIDQATDYQVRSDPSRVLAAIEINLGAES